MHFSCGKWRWTG